MFVYNFKFRQQPARQFTEIVKHKSLELLDVWRDGRIVAVVFDDKVLDKPFVSVKRVPQNDVFAHVAAACKVVIDKVAQYSFKLYVRRHGSLDVAAIFAA